MDIIWLSKNRCKLIPELYTKLTELWKIDHKDKSYLNLKQNKDTFFNNFVTYKYDHDYLHQLAAKPGQTPVYIQCLKENEDVLIDCDKFNSLSFPD